MPTLFNPDTPNGAVFKPRNVGIPMGRRRRRRGGGGGGSANNSNNSNNKSKDGPNNQKKDCMEWNEEENATTPVSVSVSLEKKTQTRNSLKNKKRNKSPVQVQANNHNNKKRTTTTTTTTTSPSQQKSSSAAVTITPILARNQSHTDYTFPDQGDSSHHNNNNNYHDNYKDNNNYLRNKPRFSFRRVFLVDTRTLDTKEGNQISDAVMSNIHNFLQQHCRLRGITPSLIIRSGSSISSPTSSTPSSRNQYQYRVVSRAPPIVPITVPVCDPDQNNNSNNRHAILTKVLIAPPINANNQHNKSAVKIPMRLLAHTSWKLYGEMIQQAITASQPPSSSSTAPPTSPLSMTLVTTDIALCCDKNTASHQRAIENLWKSVRPLFHDNKIRTIQIIVVETEANLEFVSLSRSKEGGNNHNRKGGTIDFHPTERKNKGENQMETAGDQATAIDSDEENRSPPPPKNLATPEYKTHETIQMIKEHLSYLAQQDYKKDRDRETAVMPVSITCSIIENSRLAFDALGRKWTQEIIVESTNNTMKKPTLAFDLPESLDGTQCSVRFDLKYKVMPFPVNSPATYGLLADLQLLSESHVQVVQLIPLTCIDASLLYLPMSVSAAFVPDPLQYSEMKALIHFLFQYLAQHQVALLLRSTTSSAKRQQQQHHPHSPTDVVQRPLFHLDDQVFLLIAEDGPTSLQQSPTSIDTTYTEASPGVGGATTNTASISSEGMLVRYAAGHQILDAGSAELESWKDDDDLSEFVVQAMDRLESTSTNPLLEQKCLFDREEDTGSTFSATTTPTNNESRSMGDYSEKSSQNNGPLLSDIMNEKSVSQDWTWSDKTGVGSLPCLDRQEKDSSKAEQLDDTVDVELNAVSNNSKTTMTRAPKSKKLKCSNAGQPGTSQNKSGRSLNGKVGEKKSTAKAKAPPSPESESESIFEAVKVSLESGSKNVGRKDQGEREHTLKARKAHTEKGVTVDDVLVDTEDEEDDDDEGSHGSNIQFEY